MKLISILDIAKKCICRVLLFFGPLLWVYPSHAKYENELSLKLWQESFPGKGQVEEQKGYYTTFSPSVEFNQTWGEFEKRHQELSGYIIGLLPVNSDEPDSIAAPELYFEQSFFSETLVWTLGRKKK